MINFIKSKKFGNINETIIEEIRANHKLIRKLNPEDPIKVLRIIPDALKEIHDQTHELCETAIKSDPNALRQI